MATTAYAAHCCNIVDSHRVPGSEGTAMRAHIALALSMSSSRKTFGVGWGRGDELCASPPSMKQCQVSSSLIFRAFSSAGQILNASWDNLHWGPLVRLHSLASSILDALCQTLDPFTGISYFPDSAGCSPDTHRACT